MRRLHTTDSTRLMTSGPVLLIDVSEQAAAVHSFTSARGLSLSLEKCAALTYNHTPAKECIYHDWKHLLPVESAVKCLGIWWDFSFSSKISIDDRFHKARAAFFAHGELGAFQGQLNPLFSRSLAESCIFPVLVPGLGLGLGLGPRLVSQIVSHWGPMCPGEEIPGHSVSRPAHFFGTLGLSRPGPGFDVCPVSPSRVSDVSLSVNEMNDT